ncbi:MAG: FAD-dependent oxidoreductase [Candidatus Jordarchaeales archaeon]
MFDVVVIGAGPAGLAAAAFTARRKLKTLVLEAAPTAGGKPVLLYADKMVDDFIGFPEGMTGLEIGKALERHAKKFGAEVKCNSRVVDISRTKEGLFVVRDERGEKYQSKAVIITFGVQPLTHVGVKGEDKFKGRGVRYLLEDASDVKGKRVVVVGGGETAVESALRASEVAASVVLVHRRGMLRADESTVDQLAGRVEVLYNSIVEEVRGDEWVKEVVILNRSTGERRTIRTDEVIFCVGQTPETDLLTSLGVQLSEKGEIIVNKRQETNIPGVFAAGDVTGGAMRISAAIGEGVVAALSAYNYIKKPYWSGEWNHTSFNTSQ